MNPMYILSSQLNTFQYNSKSILFKCYTGFNNFIVKMYAQMLSSMIGSHLRKSLLLLFQKTKYCWNTKLPIGFFGWSNMQIALT